MARPSSSSSVPSTFLPSSARRKRARSDPDDDDDANNNKDDDARRDPVVVATTASSFPSSSSVEEKRQRRTAEEFLEARRQRRMRRYGLNREQVMQLEAQDRCQLCGTHETRVACLHLDHCHDTGWVRGMLCGTCNTAIGHLDRFFNLGVLDKAVDWVTRWRVEGAAEKKAAGGKEQQE